MLSSTVASGILGDRRAGVQSCAVDDGHLRLSLAGADRPGSVDQLAAAISATLDCPVAITIAYAPTVIKTSAP